MEDIYNYLERERPEWTRSTMLALYEGARSLRAMPFRGRAGEKSGTLELVSSQLPFITIYRVKDGVVEVLGFKHGSQNRSSD
jgi:plasmid stabilization system protein ParE